MGMPFKNAKGAAAGLSVRGSVCCANFASGIVAVCEGFSSITEESVIRSVWPFRVRMGPLGWSVSVPTTRAEGRGVKGMSLKNVRRRVAGSSGGGSKGSL